MKSRRSCHLPRKPASRQTVASQCTPVRQHSRCRSCSCGSSFSILARKSQRHKRVTRVWLHSDRRDRSQSTSTDHLRKCVVSDSMARVCNLGDCSFVLQGPTHQHCHAASWASASQQSTHFTNLINVVTPRGSHSIGLVAVWDLQKPNHALSRCHLPSS